MAEEVVVCKHYFWLRCSIPSVVAAEAGEGVAVGEVVVLVAEVLLEVLAEALAEVVTLAVVVREAAGKAVQR